MMPDEPTRAKGIGTWNPPRSSLHFRLQSTTALIAIHSDQGRLALLAHSPTLQPRFASASTLVVRCGACQPTFSRSFKARIWSIPLPQPNHLTIRLTRAPQKLSVSFSDFS